MELQQFPPVRDQLKKCVRCGRCRTVCPIFAEIKNETVAPRGHVFMVQALRDNKVLPENQVYDRLSNCLLCETCSINCPSGIDIHELKPPVHSYTKRTLGGKGPDSGQGMDQPYADEAGRSGHVDAQQVRTAKGSPQS